MSILSIHCLCRLILTPTHLTHSNKIFNRLQRFFFIKISGIFLIIKRCNIIFFLKSFFCSFVLNILRLQIREQIPIFRININCGRVIHHVFYWVWGRVSNCLQCLFSLYDIENKFPLFMVSFIKWDLKLFLSSLNLL